MVNPEALGEDETARNMQKMIEMLQKEEEIRNKQLEEEERLRKEKEEELRKENEEKERKEKGEKDRLEKEKEDKDNWDKGKIALDVETMKKVREWIDRQDKQQKEEESQEKIKALQSQIEEMNRPENRKQCQVTGVDMFTGLDALQIEGARGMDLAAKAQAAMIAVVATKRKCDDGEQSEGESIQSRNITKFTG